MVDAADLATFVGRWGRIRPARDPGGRPAPSGSAEDTAAWIEVAVASSTDQALRLETHDPRAASLDERGVVIEVGSDALQRLQGTVRVLVTDPRPIVLAFLPFGASETLQRRNFVRVRVAVPVDVRVVGGGKNAVVSTTSIDLSGGGVRLAEIGEAKSGDALAMTFTLGDDALEVSGRVLERGRDGSRVVFEHVPEAVSKRLVRFVFDAQRDIGRTAASGPHPVGHGAEA